MLVRTDEYDDESEGRERELWGVGGELMAEDVEFGVRGGRGPSVCILGSLSENP